MSSTSTFGNARFNLPAPVSSGAFTVRYNAAGVATTWTLLDGAGADAGRGIVTDGAGNVFIAGNYTSTTATLLSDFSSTSALGPTRLTLPAASTQAAFLLQAPTGGPAPTVVGTPASISLTNNTETIDVTQFFTTSVSNGPLVLSIASAPQQNAFLDTSTGSLSIIGNNRGVSYSVIVRATNKFGRYSDISIPVTEAAPVLREMAVGMLDTGTGNDSGNAVVIDSSGFTYVVGTYVSATAVPVLDLANATSTAAQASRFSLPASSTGAAFIIKYSSGGQATAWAVLEGTGADVGRCVAVTPSALFVAGSYTSTGSVNVNDLSTSSTAGTTRFALPSSSTGATYVLKYDLSSGQALAWTTLDGTGSTEAPYGMCADSSGAIYVTGQYLSTTAVSVRSFSAVSLSAGITRFQLPAANTTGTAFAIKYDATGTPSMWSVIEGSAADAGLAVTCDTEGSFYVGGQYTSVSAINISDCAATSTAGTVRFQLPAANTGGTGFVVKFDRTGRALQWTMVENAYADNVIGLATDPSNNLYVCGNYQVNPAVYDFSSGSTAGPTRMTLANVSTQSSTYVIKFEPTGQASSWTSVQGGSAKGFAVDPIGQVIVTGNYVSISSQVALRDFSTTSAAGQARFYMPMNAQSISSAFYVLFGTDGVPRSWSVMEGDAGSSFNAVAVDGAGNAVFAGSTSQEMSINVHGASSSSMHGYPLRTLPQTNYTSTCVLLQMAATVRSTSALTATPLGSVSLTSDTASITLSDFFTTPTGVQTPITYEIVNSPYMSAKISNSGVLTVSGANRGASYNVTVRATSKFGNSVESSLAVTEAVPSPQLASRSSFAGGNAYAHAVDRQGNVYVCGSYTSASSPVPVLDISSNSTQTQRFELPAASTESMCVIKYSSSGVASSWMTMTGTGAIVAYSTVVDPMSGSFVICGSYTSTTAVSVRDMSTTSTQGSARFSLPASASGAGFVLVFNSDGQASRWTTFEGTTLDRANSVSICGMGNLYVAGQNTSAVPISDLQTVTTVGTSRFSITSASGGSAAFLIKYALTDGRALSWVHVEGSSADSGLCVRGAPDGSVWFSGFFEYHAGGLMVRDMTSANSLAPTRFTMAASSVSRGFFIKYSPYGRVLMGTTRERSTGNTMALDGSGNVYVAFQATTSDNIFDMVFTNTGANRFTISPSSTGVIIVKYSPLGTASAWTMIDGAGADTVTNMFVDSTGALYVSGSFGAAATVSLKDFSTASSTPGTTRLTMPSPAGSAGYVVKYSAAGVPQGFVVIEGTGNDVARCVTVDGAGSMCVTGAYTGLDGVSVYDFNTSSTMNSARFNLPGTSLSSSAFIAKLPSVS